MSVPQIIDSRSEFEYTNDSPSTTQRKMPLDNYDESQAEMFISKSISTVHHHSVSKVPLHGPHP